MTAGWLAGWPPHPRRRPASTVPPALPGRRGSTPGVVMRLYGDERWPYPAVPDAPQPDGPMLDDLGLEECDECGMEMPKGTRCPCGDDEPDAADYPDCTACGGVGTLSVTSKGSVTHPDCTHCEGKGVEPR